MTNMHWCNSLSGRWGTCLPSSSHYTDISESTVAYFLCIGRVENGCLYLRYGSSLKKTTAKWAKTLTNKSLYYTNVPSFLLPHLKGEKRKLENYDFVIFLTSSFFSFFMRNWKTIGHISTFYLSNQCSTHEEVLLLAKSCMWATTSVLLSKTRMVVFLFLFRDVR